MAHPTVYTLGALLFGNAPRKAIIDELVNKFDMKRDTTLSKLSKTDLLELLQQRLSSASQGREALVNQALDSKSAAAEKKKQALSSDSLSRIGTTLVLAVAEFLYQVDVASLAQCGVYLRMRLTLSVTGIPSPGLLNLRIMSLQSDQDHKIGSSVARDLLMRTSRLRALNLSRVFPTGNLPFAVMAESLQYLSVSNNNNPATRTTAETPAGSNLFHELRSCSNLTELKCTNHHFDAKTCPFPDGCSWPKLTSLEFGIESSDMYTTLEINNNVFPALETVICKGDFVVRPYGAGQLATVKRLTIHNGPSFGWMHIRARFPNLDTMLIRGFNSHLHLTGRDISDRLEHVSLTQSVLFSLLDQLRNIKSMEI